MPGWVRNHLELLQLQASVGASVLLRLLAGHAAGFSTSLVEDRDMLGESMGGMSDIGCIFKK